MTFRLLQHMVVAKNNVKTAALATLLIASAGISQAEDIEYGGKLLLTRGLTSVDGAGGGGIAAWALITGNETDRGIGATGNATYIRLPDYDFLSVGVAAGFYDRFEISYAHQEFDTGETGAALGIGDGFTFKQDILGAKLRVAGDAVYDQDRWMPQIAVGAQYKHADHGDLLAALGAEDNDGIEAYVSATKLLLDHSVIVGGALRYTDANQNGLLGFGGAQAPTIHPEVSLGYLISKRLVVGGEYRVKPDNLAFAQEDDWLDLFAAYAVTDNITATVAYADLGSIATFDDQKGLYLSLQLGF